MKPVNKRSERVFDEVVGQDIEWEGDTYYVEYRLFVRWVYDYEFADADGNRGIWIWSEDERYIKEVKKVERYTREGEIYTDATGQHDMVPIANPLPAGLQAAIEKASEAYDAAGEIDDAGDEEPPERDDY